MTLLTIGDLMLDCAKPERTRDFYADLTGWEKTVAYGCFALKTDNSVTLLFAETDFPYVPPVWPEEQGKQQKQMHLDITVDDVRAAVAQAIQLGGARAAAQYGDEQSYVTMLDPEGKPFCLCRRYGDTEFDRYYEQQGYGAIPDISINIDCRSYAALRKFYAGLTGWDQGFHPTALVSDNRMVVHFMEADFAYEPPVWPEEPGGQQKQIHFNFQVDDLQHAVDEALRLGAVKPDEQYGGGQFVTLLDPDGHPFCLCARELH